MIIIVSGLPGSGKSFFAERLASKLNGAHINSDRVRFELKASGNYSFDDKLMVYKEMLVRTTRALEENRDIIVDATFYHHTMREMFIRLGRAFNTPVRIVEVTADEGLIRRRMQQPRKFSEADFAVYEEVRDVFEEITMPHLTLHSTDGNIDAMLNTALTYIANERE